jgi:hypothetical protein
MTDPQEIAAGLDYSTENVLIMIATPPHFVLYQGKWVSHRDINSGEMQELIDLGLVDVKHETAAVTPLGREVVAILENKETTT